MKRYRDPVSNGLVQLYKTEVCTDAIQRKIYKQAGSFSDFDLDTDQFCFYDGYYILLV